MTSLHLALRSLVLVAQAALPVAAVAQSTASAPHALHLVLAPEGNEARYRVREQLATLNFPSDAVGKTTKLTGFIDVDAKGKVIEGSKITVDLVSIATDNKTRDTYVRRHVFVTDTFPTMEFAPNAAVGLPAAIPVAADVSFALTGKMSLHGVTKSCTWHVKGKMNADGEISGTATTTFKFADYNLDPPHGVARVLSVVDSITLEYDFHFVPQAALPAK